MNSCRDNRSRKLALPPEADSQTKQYRNLNSQYPIDPTPRPAAAINFLTPVQKRRALNLIDSPDYQIHRSSEFNRSKTFVNRNRSSIACQESRAVTCRISDRRETIAACKPVPRTNSTTAESEVGEPSDNPGFRLTTPPGASYTPRQGGSPSCFLAEVFGPE